MKLVTFGTLAGLLHDWGVMSADELRALAPQVADDDARALIETRVAALQGAPAAWHALDERGRPDDAHQLGAARQRSVGPAAVYEDLARVLVRCRTRVTLDADAYRREAQHVGEVLREVQRHIAFAAELLLWLEQADDQRKEHMRWAPLRRLREITDVAHEAGHLAELRLDDDQKGAEVDPVPW